MPTAGIKYKGWKWDVANSTLDVYIGATEVARFGASAIYLDKALTITGDVTLAGDVTHTGTQSWTGLITASGGLTVVGTLTLPTGSIDTPDLADNSVKNAKIYALAVTTAKITDQAVTEAKIGLTAVDTPQLKDNAVKTAKIYDNQVTTSKIVDEAVTEAKIGLTAVDTPQLKDNAVKTAKIYDNQVTTAKLVDQSVTEAKIGLTAVDTPQLKDNSVKTAKIYASQVTSAKIATLTGVLTISNATDASDSTSGALIVGGGVGVAAKLYVGTNLDVTGTSALDGAITGTTSLIVTSTAPATAINAIEGNVVASADWPSSNWLIGVKGIVTKSATGTVDNSAGGWFQMDCTALAASNVGLTTSLMVYHSSDNAHSGNAMIYIQSMPDSSANFANLPYIAFTESVTGGATGSGILFEVGHQAAGRTCTTGATGVFDYSTLRMKVNNNVRWIPLSTVSNTFTYAYPVALSYAGTALAITSAIPAGDAYSGIRSEVTAADSNNAYGVAGYFQTTTTGTQANHTYGIGSWINFSGTPTIPSYIVTPQDNGIYGTASMTNTRVFFGMRCEAVITGSPAVLAPFSINVGTGGITALFAVDALSAVTWTSGVHTSAVSGSLPIICDNDGASIKYVRTYDTAA